MIAVFALVMLFDILVYMLFVNIIVPLFADVKSANFLIPLAVMTAAAIGSHFLNGIRPRLRFLPLALLPLCFLLIPNIDITAAVILLPPCAYLAVNITVKNFSPNFEKTRRFIISCLKFACLPLGLVIFRGYDYLVQTFYFHYLFALAACGICLLRMLLNDEKTVSSPKFITLNLGLTGGVFSALFIIGSPFVLNGIVALSVYIWRGLVFIYENAVRPALFAVRDFFLWLISLIPRGDFEVPPGDFSLMPEIPAGPGGGLIIPDHAPSEFVMPQAVQWLLAIILIALAAFLIFKVMKRFVEGRMVKNPDTNAFKSQIIELDEKAARNKRRSFFTPKDPRLAIRHNYRRFLKICGKKGEPRAAGDTTAEIQQKNADNFPDAAMSRLRELYIKAKYSDKQVDKSEGKESGGLLKHF